MKKGLFLVSVLAALFSNQLNADEVSGGPRINMRSGQLTVPCVEVDDPDGEFDDKFFDVKFIQSGDSFELIFVKEEDPDVCKALIEASLNADQDTSDVNGLNGSTATTVVYQIGDTGPAGGVVFYVTDNGLHGLEAAPIDQSRETYWGCVGIVTGATGTAIGTGSSNTALIVEANCDGIPAQLAANYELNGYIDWFLPSSDELTQLYLNRDVVPALVINNFYWSSSEYDATQAFLRYFGTTSAVRFTFKSLVSPSVRAVRAF